MCWEGSRAARWDDSCLGSFGMRMLRLLPEGISVAMVCRHRLLVGQPQPQKQGRNLGLQDLNPSCWLLLWNSLESDRLPADTLACSHH